MPKNEFDPEDPMEGVGVSLPGDTRDAMTEAFIEEFALMGFGQEDLVGLFRDPIYTLPNAVWRDKGEAHVRDLIRRVAARWR